MTDTTITTLTQAQAVLRAAREEIERQESIIRLLVAACEAARQQRAGQLFAWQEATDPLLEQLDAAIQSAQEGSNDHERWTA